MCFCSYSRLHILLFRFRNKIFIFVVLLVGRVIRTPVKNTNSSLLANNSNLNSLVSVNIWSSGKNVISFQTSLFLPNFKYHLFCHEKISFDELFHFSNFSNKPIRNCIYALCSHAMQSSRNLIGTLTKFSPCMEIS